jgi:hypothetical protein
LQGKTVNFDHHLWLNRGRRLDWRYDLDHTGTQDGSCALDSETRGLRIRTLKTQLDVCLLVCSTLANELQAADLTPKHKTELARRWEKALKESQGLQLAIDTLEGQEA